MEEKQTMTNAQLQRELSGHRASATLFKILTYVFGLGTILLFGTALIPVAVVTLVLTFVFGYQMNKHTAALKKSLSDNVVNGVLTQVFENVEYNPFGHLPSKQIEEAGMVFPFAYNTVKGSDHIKTNYKGLAMELSDITLSQVDSEYNHEQDRWEETETTTFQGQWLMCDFGKELSCPVHLSAGDRKLRKQLKNGCVQMENQNFNDRFVVTAEDPQEAYYVLTPHMMDYILSAAGRSGGEVYMSFLPGGKMHIAVKSGRDFFEMGKTSADVDTLRKKFLGEIRWFTDMVDELRLEDAPRKKESSV